VANVKLEIPKPITRLLSKPKRIKIAVGGRGSGKSISVGDIMLMFAANGEQVCASREFQNSIDDSVHESLKQEIDRLGIEGMTHTNNEIRSESGGRIFYKGLARNITSLKSLAGVDKFWIEEGESVSDKSLKVLTPSVRSSAANNEEGGNPPEIWITMNRGSSADAIAQKYLKRADEKLREQGWYEDDMCLVVECSYNDNPFFPPELEQERLDDFKNLPRALYDHIWGGQYNDTVENSIIKPEWFDAAIDLHKNPDFRKGLDPLGHVVTAHDPSDAGYDTKGLCVRRGSVVLLCDEMDRGEIDDGCEWALSVAKKYDSSWFVWDGDGMGAGLKGQIGRSLQGTRIQPHMYRGSLAGVGQDNAKRYYEPMEGERKKSLYKDTFKNNRAQYSVALADRFYNSYRALVKGEYVDPDTMISLDSEGIENMIKLRSEVCRVPEKINNSGLRQIMTKDEMKKLEISSPNMFDSMVMAFANPNNVERKEFKPARRKY